jgi:predicted esterase
MGTLEVPSGMRTALVFGVFMGLLAMACRSSAPAPATLEATEGPDVPVTTSANIDAPAAPPSMEPLGGEWMEHIDLPAGGIVYVAPPLGATEPRPILVAVHGAVDDPGLICSAWRLVTDVYPFVVCPGGSKIGKGKYAWPSSDAIDQAVDAALAAVRTKYGERIAPGPVIYAAFSQGANMAGPVLGKKKGRFARAVLSEGGYRALDTAAAAKAFVAAGGERMLFTCSQSGCAGSFERSRAPLLRAGAEVRVSYSGPHGHSMPPAVRESIHTEIPWIVDGVSGWASYASAPKLPTH